MKHISFVFFISLIIVSKFSFSQTLEKEKSLIDNSSFDLFKLNEKEETNFYNKAVTAYNNKEYELSGEYFIKAFKYSTGSNKSLIYNALLLFKEATNFTKTIECYNELLKNGIDSLETQIQLNIYISMAVIYNLQNKSEKVLTCINLGQKIKPNNIELLKLKANYYRKIDDKANYILILKKINIIKPNTFEIIFNLGAIYGEQKKIKKAKYYYKKALKINKKSEDTYSNIATLLISQQDKIIDRMNSLGVVSEKDIKEYDFLDKKRKRIYKSAIPYLRKVLKLNKNNTYAIKTLIAIYENLGWRRKVRKMKKLSN